MRERLENEIDADEVDGMGNVWGKEPAQKKWKEKHQQYCQGG